MPPKENVLFMGLFSIGFSALLALTTEGLGGEHNPYYYFGAILFGILAGNQLHRELTRQPEC
jgi:hypothetical protein